MLDMACRENGVSRIYSHIRCSLLVLNIYQRKKKLYFIWSYWECISHMAIKICQHQINNYWVAVEQWIWFKNWCSGLCSNTNIKKKLFFMNEAHKCSTWDHHQCWIFALKAYKLSEERELKKNNNNITYIWIQQYRNFIFDSLFYTSHTMEISLKHIKHSKR